MCNQIKVIISQENDNEILNNLTMTRERFLAKIKASLP
jgi:DNA-directed RNA polymerase subunit H (RpoH/RPB5)